MASISSISPFLEQRREKGRLNAPVYINYMDYPQWASINNYLITGSRGTGKSSVLASFDYRLRWFNNKEITYCAEYQDLSSRDVQDTSIIGILFKADFVETGMWDRWYINEPGNGSLLFSTYLCFYFASKILESTKKIITAFFPEAVPLLYKTALINRLFYLCDPAWKRRYALLYDFSIDGLITYLGERYTEIRQTVYTGGSISMMKDDVFYSASTNFLSEFCSIICEEITLLNGRLFFLMIDDVDRFKIWQIKCINSFLKVTSSPCAWKLSSSLPYQTLATEDDARISGTDLKISYLNDESIVGRGQRKDRIDELYDAIFKTRLKEHGISCQGLADIRSLFGQMDLERALRDVVDMSINPNLKNEYVAFQLSGHKYFTDFWLIKKKILNPSDSRKKFDKYRINAVFAIVRAYNLEESFRYSSYEVIRALCAGSPRHFLRICDSMWPALAAKLKNTNKRIYQINKDDQNRAIRKASGELLELIDKDRFNIRIQSSCNDMCDRLGRLFILLTNNENSLKRSPECMSVSFELSEINDPAIRDDFLRILDKLAMTEVIKIRSGFDNSTYYQLGLNPMLSPCFFLPFRSPFLNSIKVDAELFYEFLTGDGSIDTRELAQERLAYYGPSLFDSLTDE